MEDDTKKEKNDGFLNDWKTWIIGIIILLIIIWYVCHYKLIKKDHDKQEESNSSTGTTTSDTSFDTSTTDTYIYSSDDNEDCSTFSNKIIASKSIDIEDFSVHFSAKIDDSNYDYMSISDAYKISKDEKPSYARHGRGPSIGEAECMRSVERIFPLSVFEQGKWHNWNRNPETGKRMEVDIWCEDKKFGIEYHGKQHYIYTPFFHKTEKDFENQVKRDNYKIQIFKKYNIPLIIVPYTCKFRDIENYIRRNLKLQGFSVEDGKKFF